MAITVSIKQRSELPADDIGNAEKEEQAAGRLVVNVGNAAHKDIAHGKVAVSDEGGEEKHSFTFGFVTAHGGYDTQLVELGAGGGTLVAGFTMIDGEEVNGKAEIETGSPRIFDISLSG